MGERKRAVKRFSGPTSTNLDALHDALSEATSVRVTHGGYLVYAVDEDADVLAEETEKYVHIMSSEPLVISKDSREIDDLRAALEVSGIVGSICMCPGDLAIEFSDSSGSPLEVVRFDRPGSIESRFWEGQVTLADPSRLAQWLERHGL